MSLSFQPGDETWHKLREKALSDLFFFSAVILGYVNRFPLEDETHALPIKFLERRTGIKELDEAPMQLALWPRETGKSSIGTRAHAIQLACGNPNIAILIANEKAETAQDFLFDIKYQFESNELLRALFPEIIPPDFNKTTWSASRATIKRDSGRPEATFETIGVGGTVTGKHYDVIFCDDLVSQEAMENARAGAWLIMDRVHRWITRLRPLLSSSYEPFPWIRFLGTRWWTGDVYEQLEKTFAHGERVVPYALTHRCSSGKIVTREAYRIGDLAVMRIAAIEDGVAVFPKIHPMDKLVRMRQENPEEFACLMMNEPSNEAVRTFQDAWIQHWNMLDKSTVMYQHNGARRYEQIDNLSKLCVVDPAFTASGEGARTGIVIVGTDLTTGKHLLLDAIARRMEPRDTVTEVLTRCQQWGVRRLFIEAVAQQAGFIQFIQQEALRRNLPLSIEEVKPGGRNKDVRIEGLSVYFRSGQLLVNASQTDFLEEYRKYRPGARLRDTLDALAYASERWTRIAPGGDTGNPKQRSQQQLESYLARRASRYAS